MLLMPVYVSMYMVMLETSGWVTISCGYVKYVAFSQEASVGR